MATVTINERTAKGKSLMEFLRKFEGEKFISIDDKPNKETRQAMLDAEEGRVNTYASVDDLMTSLKKKAGVHDTNNR